MFDSSLILHLMLSTYLSAGTSTFLVAHLVYLFAFQVWIPRTGAIELLRICGKLYGTFRNPNSEHMSAGSRWLSKWELCIISSATFSFAIHRYSHFAVTDLENHQASLPGIYHPC